MEKLRILIFSVFFFMTPLSFGELSLQDTINRSLGQYALTTQHFYDTTKGQETSLIEGDGSTRNIHYRYKEGDQVFTGVCMPTGCQSTGAVSCEGNQVGNLDGSCSCADGYELNQGRSTSICTEKKTCPEGTFVTGHIESVCQCENNLHQTIAIGSPNTCEAADREGGNCGPDPREGDFPNPVRISEYDDCIASERQALIDAQRLQNQSVAANNSAVDAQNNLDAAIASESATIAQSCRSAVQEFSSSCSSVRQIPQANASAASATTKERCESLSQNSKSGIESVKKDITRCVSKFNSLSSSCPSNTSTLTGNGEATVSEGSAQYGDEVVVTETSSKSGSGPVPGISGMIAEASQINSQLNSQAAQVEQELTKVETSSAQCVAALEDKPDEDPTANQFLNQAQGFAGATSKRTSSFGGYGGSELGSGSGYATGKAFGETAKNVYDNLRGNTNSGSLSPTGGLGGNMSGIGDEGVLNAGGNKTYSPKSGASGGSSNTGKTTSAGSFGGSSGNSKVAANARTKRGRTAKARNLMQGYKNVKASDGGSSISIKPSDFKKFGSKGLKKRLAAARKLHGKDLPLIFKNGKFVLDFLAMKESKHFKARTSAMETYLKGGARNTASAKELHVHENPRLNIFKIMNFRYQRQKFNE